MTIRPLRTLLAGQGPLTVSGSAFVPEAARLMRDRNVGAVMVMEGTQLAGVFTERDALFRVLAAGRDPAATPLSAVMTKAPQTIHPDKPFVEALRMMLEGGFRNVPVVENGEVLGMVSVRDALDLDVYEARQHLSQRDYDR
jgi:CBS domain-containing protein